MNDKSSSIKIKRKKMKKKNRTQNKMCSVSENFPEKFPSFFFFDCMNVKMWRSIWAIFGFHFNGAFPVPLQFSHSFSLKHPHTACYITIFIKTCLVFGNFSKMKWKSTQMKNIFCIRIIIMEWYFGIDGDVWWWDCLRVTFTLFYFTL